MYQGGFIWDFMDQVIVKHDRFGKPFMAYGGILMIVQPITTSPATASSMRIGHGPQNAGSEVPVSER